jgi:hypothetical protein
MNDLMILSWNVQTKSLGGFERTPDTVERIVKGVIDTVKLGDKGIDTPFIGFLLEIKGVQGDVEEMCELLAEEFEEQTGGRTAEFVPVNVGGEKTTAESIIVMHRGVNVEISGFDLQEPMGKFVERHKAKAEALSAQHDKMIVEKLNLRSGVRNKRYTESQKRTRFQAFRREAKWVSGGVIATVKHAANEIKVASIHAPSPKISNSIDLNKDIGIVDTIIAHAASQGVDVLIGDFNRHGDYAGANYDDLTESWTPGTGTSFKKKTPGELTSSRWDRIFAKKGHTFNITAEAPIPITRPVNLGAPLTDHALIAARVSFAPMRNNNNNWVNNNNNWVDNTPLTASVVGTKVTFRLKSSVPPTSDITSESPFASSGEAGNILAPTRTAPFSAPSSIVNSEQTLTSSEEVESIIPLNPFPRVESPLVTRRAESPLSTPPVPSAPPVFQTNSLTATETASSGYSPLNRSSSATTETSMSFNTFTRQFPSAPNDMLGADTEFDTFSEQFRSVPNAEIEEDEVKEVAELG